MEDVWRRNAPQIYKLCRSRCCTKEAADDLFQEVALKFCKSAPSLDLKYSLRHWFETVTLRTHYEIYRRRSRLLPLSVMREDLATYEAYPEQSATHFNNENRERSVQKALQSFMSVLDSEETLITELSFIGGILLRDISQLYGVTQRHLRLVRGKAIKKMREKKRLMDLCLKKMDAPSLLLEDLLTKEREIS